MIDTIVLALSKGIYQISDPDKFTPSVIWIMADDFWKRGSIQSKQNPTKKELLQGIYKPRL